MSGALAEYLTSQFYQWERRGRGWDVFETPVQLEPPFEPFLKHASPVRPVDDGKVPTLLSSLAGMFSAQKEDEYTEDDLVDANPTAFIYTPDSLLCHFTISFPKNQRIKVQETEQFLLMLSSCLNPVSFEIIGTSEAIFIQLTCRESDAGYIQGQLTAYFPNAVLQQTEDLLIISLQEGPTHIVDFGLKEEFMRPLKTFSNFDLDPLTSFFGVLGALDRGEMAMLQVLFSGTVNPWSESIICSVSDNKGHSFFEDAPEMVPLAREKTAHPLFGVVIRIVGQANSEEKAYALTNSLGSVLTYSSRSSANSLMPLPNDDYDQFLHEEDLFNRISHRLGMLLNIEELAGIVHFPSDSITTPKLFRNVQRTKAAPTIAVGNNQVLGLNYHQGGVIKTSLNSVQRLKHTHIIGATGTGKSTFLQNLIVQDIQNGQGVAVLDPHGDLIEGILPWIPKERYKDVIIVDPSDAEFPIGFNILSAYSEIEKDILSSDLVAVFKRLSTSWGDQMNSVFANAILAFLESTEGGTLIDLRRFLIEKDFRDSFLKTIKDSSIVYYWQKEFPLLKTSSIGPILTRLDSFLRPKLIRNMVAQKKGLNMEAVLDEKKILLVKLSQGLIGAENSYLLGSFVVSKIQQTAMARQAKSKDERSDFFLYIDEFQNFITPSMSSILSGARKYHLSLTLAHQDMGQVVRQDTELASSILSNAGTRICFRVGDQDAKKFEDGFSFFEAKDLQNLNTGEAIVRIDRPEFDFNISIEPLLELKQEEKENTSLLVLQSSRENYATPREAVEEVLKIVQTDSLKIEEKPRFVQKPIPVESPNIIKEPVLSQAFSVREKQNVSQHRYLQTLIKKMAESRGYVAMLEQQTPDGKGRIDVSLERNSRRIACEVCVTTTEEWEVHNIQKCLDAGYDMIVECSTDKRVIENIRNRVKNILDIEAQSKVMICDPEHFFLYLDQEVAQGATNETRIKGYRVKVNYEAALNSEMKQKRASVTKVVVDAMKRVNK